MKVVVVADAILKEEFLQKRLPVNIQVLFVPHVIDIPKDADVIFDLLFKHDFKRLEILKQFLPKLVFINSVSVLLKNINLPFIRINGWPTFLKRNIIEFFCFESEEKSVLDFFNRLDWKYKKIPDVYGMVSARIVAMIINEAFFTFGNEISTKDEIDTAMKYGTNYPYGPFEWVKLINVNLVYELLCTLNKIDPLYELAPALIAEATLNRN